MVTYCDEPLIGALRCDQHANVASCSSRVNSLRLSQVCNGVERGQSMLQGKHLDGQEAGRHHQDAHSERAGMSVCQNVVRFWGATHTDNTPTHKKR